MRCNHCADAPCVDICPTAALFSRDDGIVDFDNRRCIACKACMQACPYDALYIDPDTHTAAKCNYCAHRVEIGLEPACVVVCPEHAIISGDMDNPDSEISQLLAREEVTERKAEKGTQPKLFYIDGDEASLNPILTEPSNSYMWSSQSSGVGHYAKYAEKRMAESDREEMAAELQEGQGGKRWVGEESDVLVPPGDDDKKMLQKALQVVKERARRVYDAPSEGVVWGWKVSAYIWTKAIATGAFLMPFMAMTFGLASVPEIAQWLGLSFGLVFLTATGVLLIKDLDQPARFIYVLLRPHWKSWLVRGGYAIAFYGFCLALWGLAKLFSWDGLLTFAFWGSALLAVTTAVYTAFLFAQARGRDFWQSPTLSFHMLVHAVLAGAAVFGIFSPVFSGAPSWNYFVRLTLTTAIVINLGIIFIELLTAHTTEDARRTIQMIVSGRFRMMFLAGTLLIGNGLPLLIMGVAGTTLLPLAAVAVLLGMYITEHIWVRAPQHIPLS